MSASDNYYFFRPANSTRENLYIRAGGWNQALDNAVQRSGVRHIVIDHWEDEDLSFLTKHCNQLDALSVRDPDIADISAISSLHKVRHLDVFGRTEQIEFKRLQALRSCGIESKTVPRGVVDAGSIEELTLVCCRTERIEWLSPLEKLRKLELQEMPLQSFQGLKKLTALKELLVAKARIATLDGVQGHPSLEVLQVAHLPSLNSISSVVTAKTLHKLDIEACRRIDDLDTIRGCEPLRALHLIGVGRIQSIGFIGGLKNLEEIAIWEDTYVVDGDLSVLLSLPKLRTAYFRNRRHYSHTEAQIVDELRRKAR